MAFASTASVADSAMPPTRADTRRVDADGAGWRSGALTPAILADGGVVAQSVSAGRGRRATADGRAGGGWFDPGPRVAYSGSPVVDVRHDEPRPRGCLTRTTPP
ncbi:hypothetical protein Cpa01nite_07470 [Cellulomonas pakistanensis]|uniref:Uncharacterized protein n=1 Tax=Cellulomonas pakistanensis TaxID=992287 RepID=A0A919U2N1_9CELL|nr:hypothetical protein Cpa01nite_07470 [Cellulomonas pakistanensis]